MAPETRERVERMLREYGYQRPEPARETRAPLLDVVFNELESPWAMEIIKGVEEVARENDLGVVLSAQEGPGALGRSWVDAVAARRSAGLILVVSELSAEQIARLTARRIPFVVVDPAGEPATGVPVGRRDQLERRPGRHAAPARTRSHADRDDRRPRRHALQPRPGRRLPRGAGDGRADGRPGPDPLGHVPRRGRLRPRHGAAAAADPPTAIFAGSDLQAFGVYEAARVLGVEIPAQLSVIGFDDLPMARWVGPPLTTIRQPLTEMAATAARLVLGQGEDQRVELATTLVVRQSTRDIR